MALTKDKIDEIISKNDIVDVIGKYLDIAKKGQNYVALCPFHDDNNPSLSISPSRQIFKCFVCEEKGGVVAFVQKKLKTSYKEALKVLAENANIQINDADFVEEITNVYNPADQELLDLLNEANTNFKIDLLSALDNDEIINNFYFNRKLNKEILSHFDIGFCNEQNFKNDFKKELLEKQHLFLKGSLIRVNEYNNLDVLFKNRITFGIRDSYNNIVGFSTRTLQKDVKPKYINSAESSIFKKNSILYNFYNATYERPNELYLTEGFFDVIALYKINVKNAIALMGTALTDEHCRMLQDYHVNMFLDGDTAGLEATLRSSLLLLQKGITVEVIKNNTQYDPDEILNQWGAEHLKKMLINSRINAVEFAYNYLITKYQLIKNSNNDLNSLMDFEQEFSEFLKTQKVQIQNYYIETFKKEFSYTLNQDKFIKNNDNNNNKIFTKNNPYIEKPLEISKNKHSVKPSDFHASVLFYLVLKYPGLHKLFVEKIKVKPINVGILNEKNQKLFNVLKKPETSSLQSETIINENYSQEEINKFNKEFENAINVEKDETKVFENCYEITHNENYEAWRKDLNSKANLRSIIGQPFEEHLSKLIEKQRENQNAKKNK